MYSKYDNMLENGLIYEFMTSRGIINIQKKLNKISK